MKMWEALSLMNYGGNYSASDIQIIALNLERAFAGWQYAKTNMPFATSRFIHVFAAAQKNDVIPICILPLLSI